MKAIAATEGTTELPNTASLYLKAELNTKTNHLNFWNQTTLMMPWDFRNTNAVIASPKLPPISSSIKIPRCRDFKTQAEVINFLKKHPEYRSRLDRDGVIP